MLAGYRYSSDDAELLTLQSMLTDLLARVDMVGALFSQFPILRYIAPEKSGYNYFVEIHERIGAFLQVGTNTFTTRTLYLNIKLMESAFANGRWLKKTRVAASSCHKRQKPQTSTPQAPIRYRQTRKVANAKGLNRNTNLT